MSEAVLKADTFGAAQRRSRFFLLAISGYLGQLEEDYLRSVTNALKAPAMPLSWAIGDLLDREPADVLNTPPAVSKVNRDRIEYLFSEGLQDLPDAQGPDCHKNGTSYTSVYGRMFWDGPSQTITTGIGSPGQGRYIHPLRQRLITPHEASRIQGFPDWFDFMPRGAASRKNLNKWIGDAVHPILAYAAGLAAINAVERPSLEARVQLPDGRAEGPSHGHSSRVACGEPEASA